MELACDAFAVRKLSKNKRKKYALALLSAASGKTYYASAFGGAKTKVRIEHVLSYKKLTVFSTACFAILITVIAITVITNAAGG